MAGVMLEVALVRPAAEAAMKAQQPKPGWTRMGGPSREEDVLEQLLLMCSFAERNRIAAQRVVVDANELRLIEEYLPAS